MADIDQELPGGQERHGRRRCMDVIVSVSALQVALKLAGIVTDAILASPA